MFNNGIEMNRKQSCTFSVTQMRVRKLNESDYITFLLNYFEGFSRAFNISKTGFVRNFEPGNFSYKHFFI